MRAYYPVQMGASFAQGAMDAYNRYIGMQADIKRSDQDFTRYQDALTFRNQQAEQQQAHQDQSWNLQIAGQALNTRLGKGELRSQHSANQQALSGQIADWASKGQDTTQLQDMYRQNETQFDRNIGHLRGHLDWLGGQQRQGGVGTGATPYSSRDLGRGAPQQGSDPFASPAVSGGGFMGSDGMSADRPIQVSNRDEYDAAPAGAWIQPPRGEARQKGGGATQSPTGIPAVPGADTPHRWNPGWDDKGNQIWVDKDGIRMDDKGNLSRPIPEKPIKESPESLKLIGTTLNANYSEYEEFRDSLLQGAKDKASTWDRTKGAIPFVSGPGIADLPDDFFLRQTQDYLTGIHNEITKVYPGALNEETISPLFLDHSNQALTEMIQNDKTLSRSDKNAILKNLDQMTKGLSSVPLSVNKDDDGTVTGPGRTTSSSAAVRAIVEEGLPTTPWGVRVADKGWFVGTVNNVVDFFVRGITLSPDNYEFAAKAGGVIGGAGIAVSGALRRQSGVKAVDRDAAYKDAIQALKQEYFPPDAGFISNTNNKTVWAAEAATKAGVFEPGEFDVNNPSHIRRWESWIGHFVDMRLDEVLEGRRVYGGTTNDKDLESAGSVLGAAATGQVAPDAFDHAKERLNEATQTVPFRNVDFNTIGTAAPSSLRRNPQQQLLRPNR